MNHFGIHIQKDPEIEKINNKVFAIIADIIAKQTNNNMQLEDGVITFVSFEQSLKELTSFNKTLSV